MRAALSLFAFVVMVSTSPGHAQGPSTPHTSVSEIRSLHPDRLDAGGVVRLEGVVVLADDTGFSLHDGHFGIRVSLDESASMPPVGAWVVVEGNTGTHRPGGQVYPRVFARQVVQENLASPPVPLPTSIRDLAAFRHWDQFVTVDGIVLDQSWSDGGHDLLIGAPDGWAVIHVLNSPKERFSPDLIGSRIRARGINQGEDHSPLISMCVAAPEHWQILTLGSDDPFALPLTPLSEIAEAEVPALPLTKVRGWVLHVSPQHHLSVREASGIAFRVAIFTPLEKPGAEGLASSVLPYPGVSPGDEIEAVGVVADTGKDVGLRFCQVRVLAPRVKPPVPVVTTIPAVFEGQVTNQVVTLSGRLVERQQIDLGAGRFRSVLVLEDDSKLLRCQLDSTLTDPYADFHRNDLIEVTGLIPGSPDRDPLHLVLQSKEDALSRGLSPDVLFRRVWIWGGMAALLLSLLAIWVDSLRRSLARVATAEASVRELNATLEDRVHERTAELEAARVDLHRALGQEQELGLLKTRFVAMVSHEFRTPLGVTMSALELLRHYRARLSPEKQGELLEDIFSATLRMSGLMEQILLLGQAESGRMNLRPVPLDLPALSRSLIGESLAATGMANPMDLSFEGELDPVALDESLLRLILGNLITNAIKYSAPDGRVSLRAARTEAGVTIEIADEGIGIPVEDQAHLFEAFHRASNVGSTSGTGLGLLLVKRCVEIHRGTITFESEAGRGTRFCVTLPVDPA